MLEEARTFLIQGYEVVADGAVGDFEHFGGGDLAELMTLYSTNDVELVELFKGHEKWLFHTPAV